MIRNILVILAAGLGLRFESDVPKQYTLLSGKEVLRIVLDRMLLSAHADQIVVVLDSEERIRAVRSEYDVDAILGGNDRAHSFQNAIDYVEKTYPVATNVIFHEAARPLIQADIIDTYFDLLDEYDYVETCKKITDSLGSYTISAPNRDDYYLIQAPEAYRIEVLKQYYDCDSEIYFAANQFPDTCRGYRYFDVKNNIKLTTPEDKVLIEYLLDKQANEA